MIVNLRTYEELIILDTFKQRFNYLKLSGKIGSLTFGIDRYINQTFYRSPEWRRIRQEVIIRDKGLDLGCKGRPIQTIVLVHHMNPVSVSQLKNLDPLVIDPNFLISVSFETHQAIHYASKYILADLEPDRKHGDTNLW